MLSMKVLGFARSFSDCCGYVEDVRLVPVEFRDFLLLIPGLRRVTSSNERSQASEEILLEPFNCFAVIELLAIDPVHVQPTGRDPTVQAEQVIQWRAL